MSAAMPARVTLAGMGRWQTVDLKDRPTENLGVGCLTIAVVGGWLVVLLMWLVIAVLGDDFDQNALHRDGWTVTGAWAALSLVTVTLRLHRSRTRS